MDADFWNQRFRGEDYFYGTEPNDYLRARAVRIPAGGRVLCLAEGEGRHATVLAARGHRVTAVDFSAEGLRKAERLAGERGVTLELVVADLAAYEPERDAFAAVIFIFCHLPPEVRRVVLARAAAALVPGGAIVLEAYTPRQLAFGTGGPREPELLIEPEELRAELQLARLGPLAIEELVEVEREVREGSSIGGWSATVQALARRSA